MRKLLSDFVQVFTEGKSTDGRTITRQMIDEMAETYDRAKYGARIWLEHIRGLTADSLFPALGDVFAVESRDVQIDGKPRRALFAQLAPGPALIALNRQGQKIYTSVEVQPNFADSGKHYLVGLAVTDSPASLGTEALQFSALAPMFAARKQAPDNVFTAAEEVAGLTFVETPDLPDDDDPGSDEDEVRAFAQRLDAIEASFTERLEAIYAAAEPEALRASLSELASASDLAALKDDLAQAKADLTQAKADFAALKAELDATPAPGQSLRPPATGGSGAILTDC